MHFISREENSPGNNEEQRRNYRPSNIASRLFHFAITGGQSTEIPSDRRINNSHLLIREQLFPTSTQRRFASQSTSRGQFISASSEYMPRSETLQNPSVLRQLYRRQPTSEIATTHPSFRTKVVCELHCQFCKQNICARGMKAILLADTTVNPFNLD